tara:strand:+ start:504 stop:1298 length:795 start_codon:yes stop_codon:yes gene_type:complete
MNLNKLFLNRYYNVSENIFNKIFDSTNFNFSLSKLSTFKDLSEGVSKLTFKEKEAFLDHLNFPDRVIKDSGVLESNSHIRKHIYSSLYGLSDIEIGNIESHINNLENYFASCWFSSKGSSTESRYMWNIYAKTICQEYKPDPKKTETIAFKISCNEDELKETLLRIDRNLNFNKVKYRKRLHSNRDPYFIKDISYKHENEFRILKYDSSNNQDRISIKIPIETISEIIFDNPSHIKLIDKISHLKNVCKRQSLKEGELRTFLNM